MRHRIALTLHAWAIRIGGPVFVLAIRQAVALQLQAEHAAAQRAKTEVQVHALHAHRQTVAHIARSN